MKLRKPFHLDFVLEINEFETENRVENNLGGKQAEDSFLSLTIMNKGP